MMIYKVIIVFIVVTGSSMIGCFHERLLPTPPLFDSEFDGCFSDSNEWGGITIKLSLNEGLYLLSGTLVVGQGTLQKSYSLTGKVREGANSIIDSNNTATLNAIDLEDPDKRNEIVAILGIGDKMTIQINNGPPSKPLSRCTNIL